MVNYKQIQECFAGLVGFRPTADECVDVDLTGLDESSSGIWFQGIPGMTLSLLRKALDKDSADLTEFLNNLYKDACNDVIQAYAKRHTADINTKSVLQNFDLGMSVKNVRETTAKSSRFVYVQFKGHKSMPVSLNINDISFAGDTNGTFDLYIYSSESIEAYETVTVTVVAGKVEWQSKKLFIDLTGNAVYRVGYYEDDLTGAAILTKIACGGCSGSPAKKYSPYVMISGGVVSSGNTYLDKSIPDFNESHTEYSYGMNFRITVGCDLTRLFCDNSILFAKALQTQLGIISFWMVFNSKALESDVMLTKDDARLNAEKLELDLASELKKIGIDFSGIDCACVGQRRGLPVMSRLG